MTIFIKEIPLLENIFLTEPDIFEHQLFFVRLIPKHGNTI